MRRVEPASSGQLVRGAGFDDEQASAFSFHPSLDVSEKFMTRSAPMKFRGDAEPPQIPDAFGMIVRRKVTPTNRGFAPTSKVAGSFVALRHILRCKPVKNLSE